MAKNANPALIGGFVVGAMALAVGGVLLFGSGDFLAKESKSIAYFDSSVDGLDIGAPIKYRGVVVGKVSGIEAVWDPDADTIRIPVELTFTEYSLEGQEEAFGGLSQGQVLASLVDLGLRAELRKSSFVTGKLFVAMDFSPETPARFVGGTDLPEVPTKEGGLQEVMKSIEELPFDELVDSAISAMHAVEELARNPRIDQVLADLDQLLKNIGPEIGPLSTSLQATLDDARTLMNNADGEVQAVSTDLRSVLQNTDAQVGSLSASATASFDEAREAFALVSHIVGDRYGLFPRISALLEELAGAARAVRVLAAYLERYPEALVSGKENR